MTKLRFVHHPDVTAHQPPSFMKRGKLMPVPEVKERAEAIMSLLAERGAASELAPDYGSAPLAQVHSLDYLAFLESAHRRWSELPDSSSDVIPNVFQGPGLGSYPRGIVGQAGYHMMDLSSPIGAGTWTAASAAANVAVHAAHLVASQGIKAAYALCRPPGHHAGRERAGGFCYLNNAAIAAAEMLALLPQTGKKPRLAILDIDLHHGNGTQEIFYERDDVLFVSLHADPADFYPFLSGYSHETGTGTGKGATVNFPLPIGTSEDRYLEVCGQALAIIRRFGPESLIVSLGFDTFEGDPYKGFHVSTRGFSRIGRLIAEQGYPTLLIQEGGYAVNDLKANLSSFIDGFESL